MAKLCEFENCKKRANYAFFFNKPLKCVEHKEVGMKTQVMICVCGRVRPTFGYTCDERPSCCAICIKDGMVNIKDKHKCKCKLVSQPKFGLISDKTPTCCSKCKTDDMINFTTKCIECQKKLPTFGLDEDKPPTHCGSCKKDGMIDVKNKKCEKCKITRPTFGLDTDKPATHCENCKTDTGSQ